MEGIVVGLAWAAIIALYFLPTLVANHKGKKNAGRIFVLDLLLGWTVIGWIGALIWAAADD